MTTRYHIESAAGPLPGRLMRIGIAGLVTLLVMLALATPLDAQRMSTADLRCLTSKQDDCLPEPMPVDEPHRAICATCHNVWTQKTHAEAAKTCAGSDCHARPDTLTPFHRGLAVQVRRNCVGCHPAHDVRIPRGGGNCTFCHTAGGTGHRGEEAVRAAVADRDGGENPGAGPALPPRAAHRRGVHVLPLQHGAPRVGGDHARQRLPVVPPQGRAVDDVQLPELPHRHQVRAPARAAVLPANRARPPARPAAARR
jgi:hypothetical protein